MLFLTFYNTNTGKLQFPAALRTNIAADLPIKHLRNLEHHTDRRGHIFVPHPVDKVQVVVVAGENVFM